MREPRRSRRNTAVGYSTGGSGTSGIWLGGGLVRCRRRRRRMMGTAMVKMMGRRRRGRRGGGREGQRLGHGWSRVGEGIQR